MQCIMIKFDNNILFISKNDINKVKELIETFRAKVFLVETDKTNITEIKNLPKKICKENNKKFDYKIIKEMKKENDAEKIRNFIEKEILTNKKLSIKKVKSKFKSTELSNSTLYNQITKVKKELEKKGLELIKITTGTYETKKK